MSIYRRMLGRNLPCSLQRILSLPTATAPSATDPYQQGLKHLALNQPGLARRTLQSTVNLAPTRSECRAALAAAFEMLAQHAAAAEQLDLACATLHPVPTSYLDAAGFAHERAGNVTAAVHRYRRSLAQNPSGIFPLHRLVAVHLACGRVERAIDTLRQLLNQTPADQSARAALAHLLLSRQEHEQAAWEYQQALCLEPDSWEMPLEMARELQCMDSPDEAIGALERMIAVSGHFPDLRMRLANLYSLRGDDEAARAEFRRALSMHPDYLECHIAVARHELRMGRGEIAAEHFRTAIAINNQQVELYVGLGLCQRHLREDAAETFGSASRIANNSAVLMVQLGMLEIDYDEPARAHDLSAQWVDELIAHSDWLLERHPSWIDLRIEKGMFHRLLGRLDEAREELQAAALDEPSSSDSLLQLGLVLVDAGRTNLATTVFRAALELDEASAALGYRLALIYCGGLEFDLAMEATQETNAAPDDVQRRIWNEIDAMIAPALRQSEPAEMNC